MYGDFPGKHDMIMELGYLLLDKPTYIWKVYSSRVIGIFQWPAQTIMAHNFEKASFKAGRWWMIRGQKIPSFGFAYLNDLGGKWVRTILTTQWSVGHNPGHPLW